VLVGAFEGWNDAGDGATSAVEHLELIWDAKPLAAIDPDDYYDFQVNRPLVSMSETPAGRRIEWPTTRVSTCTPPGADRDVVLVRGIEPNMRWRGFCEEILELFHALDVDQVVLLGALLADTPHSRQFPVTGSASDAELANRYDVRHRRRAARRVRACGDPVAVVLGAGAALRRAGPEPEGDARVAAHAGERAGPAGADG
jgi:hypothetical protein